MELLIGAVVTLGTEFFKFFLPKVQNKKLLEAIIIGFAFIASTAGVFIWKYFTDGIELSSGKQIIETLLIGVGYYELVLKRIVTPIIERSKKITL